MSLSQSSSQEGGVSKEKLDFVVAFGENIMNLPTSQEIQRLEGLTDASAHAKDQPFHQFNDSSEEFVSLISEMVAKELLAEPHGQVAMKAVHRFLAYNAEWVGQVVGVQVGLLHLWHNSRR